LIEVGFSGKAQRSVAPLYVRGRKFGMCYGFHACPLPNPPLAFGKGREQKRLYRYPNRMLEPPPPFAIGKRRAREG